MKILSLKKNLEKKTCKCAEILIVDDDEFNILALKILVEQLNFKSNSACRGDLAIKKIINRFKENICCKSYKLVFMDSCMPVKNGYETTKVIFI